MIALGIAQTDKWSGATWIPFWSRKPTISRIDPIAMKMSSPKNRPILSVAAAMALTCSISASFRAPSRSAAASAIGEHARKRGYDPASFAVAWVLANEAVTGAIAGPKTMAQWESYLAAFDIDWTAEDEAAVDAIVPRGTTAIAQFVDPAYPVEGRYPAGKALS